ncbi:hypothetical protein PaG_00957 [Moesziomyces aphidis]|uniref:Uncharacterized protein n=1 Tax=Moesziomyces aphidis TaxID=84754 RepID=W3VSJ9_MOEAP|nr:hypothetical protein PaG_00957 [Moesziomyces aphidis]
MLHSFPPSFHQDPFHCSSSPDRLSLASYVATRPNPYTVKSQNTQYYTSLRSTAQPLSLSPRRASLGAANASSTSSPQLDAIDRAHSSFQAAARTPRCYSKPHGLSPTLCPQLTMVKSKKRPVKGLVVREEQMAAKRTSTAKLSPAAINKRQQHVVEAAKHRARSTDAAVQSSPTLDPMLLETDPFRPEMHSPLSSPSPSPAAQSRSRATARMSVPRITIRSPTPELDPEHQRLLQAESSSTVTSVEAPETPLYSKSLLDGLRADVSRVEDDIDAILSKYLEPRQSVRSISIEFLRSLTSSVCRLHSYVEDAHSPLGFAKLRAISSHLFRHAVTGFLHLLEDPIAPYETAANLALVSAKIVHDFDKATELCCRLLDVPSQGKEKINHGKLFANVLNGELDIVLDRGEAAIDGHNKLALPGTGALFFDAPSCGKDGLEAGSFAGGSAWKGRASLRKQWAQEGEERNQFAAMDVVRFVGELGVQEVVTVSVVARWLDRFLTRTAYIDIPSAWEIECACALLITVGATLDRRAYPSSRSRNAGKREGSNALQLQDAVASSPTTENPVQGDKAAIETMQKTMDRIDFLVTHADISPAAREWLIEVERLRERGWSRDDDDHLPDMSFFSN